MTAISLLFPCCGTQKRIEGAKKQDCQTAVLAHVIAAVAIAVILGAAVALATYFLTQGAMTWTLLSGGGAAVLFSAASYVLLRCLLGRKAEHKSSASEPTTSQLQTSSEQQKTGDQSQLPINPSQNIQDGIKPIKQPLSSTESSKPREIPNSDKEAAPAQAKGPKIALDEIKTIKNKMTDLVNSVLNAIDHSTHRAGREFFIRGGTASFISKDYQVLRDQLNNDLTLVINSLNEINYDENTQDFYSIIDKPLAALLAIDGSCSPDEKEEVEQSKKSLDDFLWKLDMRDFYSRPRGL